MDLIRAKDGWFVSHHFYRLNTKLWSQVSDSQKAQGCERFVELVKDTRRMADCQINCYSVWGLKADLAIMAIDPDLQHLNETETALSRAFSPGILEPTYSFISMSEVSEYMSQDQDYDRTLREKDGLTPESPAYQEKMRAFKERIQVYIDDRLYPQLPEHSVMCFYPMNKSRLGDDNWYLLDFDSRKRYMAGHAITGRKYQKDVKQLVTGAIGLDDWEWGVTLFAEDPYYFKKIVYEMRYDEASARYGEFGPFYIGIRLEPQELIERLKL